MATSEATTRVHTREGVWTSGLVAAAVAVAILVLASVIYVATDQPSKGAPVIIPATEVAGTELMRDLVNRGLIPEQALEPADRSRDELMRDLVNRGLIPAQALDPADRDG